MLETEILLLINDGVSQGKAVIDLGSHSYVYQTDNGDWKCVYFGGPLHHNTYGKTALEAVTEMSNFLTKTIIW